MLREKDKRKYLATQNKIREAGKRRRSEQG
jgi:hypothetical protein